MAWIELKGAYGIKGAYTHLFKGILLRGDVMASQKQQPTGEENAFDRQLAQNIERLRQEFGNSPDYVIRSYTRSHPPIFSAAAVYNTNLADEQAVEGLIEKLFGADLNGTGIDDSNAAPLEWAAMRAALASSTIVTPNWDMVVDAAVAGDTVLFIDGCTDAIVVSTRGMEWRTISESTTQLVIRGPKDSFTESISTNISLIRRRIRNKTLWLERFSIGNLTATNVSMLYLKGIANERTIQELRQRMNAIQEDGILETGTIERHVQDQHLTPFPTLYNTERPDDVVGHLMDGRIAVLVDGTPFALIGPITFFHFFQSVEDFYQRADIGLLIRVLRYIGYFLSMLLPALYIAAMTFHQEMIPTPLLISLVAQREGVPFPVIVEALLMELSFELMREAGVRMPRAVGQAVSIVGALILGQAAVQAGIVSAAMVIVVAATGIASFTAPAFSIAISVRILRFGFMMLASMFGLFGIVIGLFILTAHLSSLQSLGSPYFSIQRKGRSK